MHTNPTSVRDPEAQLHCPRLAAVAAQHWHAEHNVHAAAAAAAVAAAAAAEPLLLA